MESTERESAGFTSTASLLRSIGSLTHTSGRGLLMFRCLAVSATTAALTGLCGAYIGGMLAIGGGHLFVVGSCVGYVSSSIYFYRNQIREAFAAFDEYPELMKLHLIMNFPMMRFQSLDLRPARRARERARIGESWYLTSMLASAYQTASPSIEEILHRREQALIAEFAKGAEAQLEEGQEKKS